MGETVSLALDTAKRILHAVLHSAGHAIDKAMKMVVGDSVFVPLKGYHFVDSPYVEYQGILPGGLEKHAFIEQVGFFLANSHVLESLLSMFTSRIVVRCGNVAVLSRVCCAESIKVHCSDG